MSITAYDGIFSLLVFMVFLVPAVVAGLKGYSLRRYGMLISLPLLYMLVTGLKGHCFQAHQSLLKELATLIQKPTMLPLKILSPMTLLGKR